MSDTLSLSKVLDKVHQKQLALEATIMESTLTLENQGLMEAGKNVRGLLNTINEDAVYVKQGLISLEVQNSDRS